MTISEFIDKLRKTKGPWKLTEDGRIRCGMRCPIAKVAGVPQIEWGEGAEMLSLGWMDRWTIAFSADHEHGSNTELRAQLIAATVNRQ